MSPQTSFLLLWLTFAPQGWREIAPGDFVPNRSGKQCWAASLETLGRHQKVPALYSLTSDYRDGATTDVITAVLRARGAHTRIRHEGTTSIRFLKEARRYGCAVALYPRLGSDEGHMVVCLGADDAGVRLIDNAGPLAGQVQTVPLLDFLARWTGYAVIVYPHGAGPLPYYGE